jgi:phosphoglycerate kinase
MPKLTLEDLELKDRRVLMRVDFNVPLENKNVADDKRIRAVLNTIRYAMDKGAKLILMSHLGRPKGRRVPEMSLAPVVPVLSELIGQKVNFVEECVGDKVEEKVAGLKAGEVLLLENLRFHPEETANDSGFAAKLGRLGDLFINDAFGTAHRAHASTVGVTQYIDTAAAGFLIMKELDYLGKAVEDPVRPFVAILGGAKISGKIDVISNLLNKVDRLIIGGGMAYTFFAAMGYCIGDSLLEADKVDLARNLLNEGGDKIVLPVDCLVSDEFDFNTRRVGILSTVSADSMAEKVIGLDIGNQTIATYKGILEKAKTVIWNGPMGVFEIDATAQGTFALARMLAAATDRGAVTVIGGGDSAAAVRLAGVEKRISHISTGGGASLEFLEGKVLPGVAALSEKQ